MSFCQVQRRDTSYGLVGDGPNRSPGKLRSRVAPAPSVVFAVTSVFYRPRNAIRPARRQVVHEIRVYKTQHQYYCGVDLHARSLLVNILDATGTTRFERDLPVSPFAFLDAIEPRAGSR